MSATTTREDRAIELSRQIVSCCEGHAPQEAISALTIALATVTATVADSSVDVTTVLGVVQRHVYDAAMTLIAARQPRH